MTKKITTYDESAPISKKAWKGLIPNKETKKAIKEKGGIRLKSVDDIWTKTIMNFNFVIKKVNIFFLCFDKKYFCIGFFKYKGRELLRVHLEYKQGGMLRVFYLFTWYINFKPRFTIKFYIKF